MKQLELFETVDVEGVRYGLFEAYFDARRNKRNTINALAFEKHFESSIFELADEILRNDYSPKPGICFIVKKPVQREIFASDFRDRVVHHFIYNAISPVFEGVFINDSYSCRKGKGTSYGIRRMDHFIRSCSGNYRFECYILKMDIRGYFMSMDRFLLYDKIRSTLLSKAGSLDFNLPLVLGLIEKTLFNDPTRNCTIKGKKSDWTGLPRTKSLFHARPECGLPIGNLTSQLFGNIYLNDFDHWVKRDLGIRYYGRYVDDFVLIHPGKEYLKGLLPAISDYLLAELKLELHPDKVYLQHYERGVKFLGTVIKPHRIYIANRTKGNFHAAIERQNQAVVDHPPAKKEQDAFLSSMNSYLGIMKHYNSYGLRRHMILKGLSGRWWNYVYQRNYAKFILKRGKTRITKGFLNPICDFF